MLIIFTNHLRTSLLYLKIKINILNLDTTLQIWIIFFILSLFQILFNMQTFLFLFLNCNLFILNNFKNWLCLIFLRRRANTLKVVLCYWNQWIIYITDCRLNYFWQRRFYWRFCLNTNKRLWIILKRLKENFHITFCVLWFSILVLLKNWSK